MNLPEKLEEFDIESPCKDCKPANKTWCEYCDDYSYYVIYRGYMQKQLIKDQIPYTQALEKIKELGSINESHRKLNGELREQIKELEYKISCIQLTITDTDTIEWLDGEGNKKVFHSEETALTKEEAGFIVEYFGVTDSASDFYLNSIPFYTQVIAKLQKIAGK